LEDIQGRLVRALVEAREVREALAAAGRQLAESMSERRQLLAELWGTRLAAHYRIAQAEAARARRQRGQAP
jgi:hypothetical protein